MVTRTITKTMERIRAHARTALRRMGEILTLVAGYERVEGLLALER